MELTTLQEARFQRTEELSREGKFPKLSLFQQPATDVAKLLSTGQFSDYTIRCSDDITFKVHKAHLSPQSHYFEQVTSARFKEGGENEVVLDDVEPLPMAMLLLLIYIGNNGIHLDEVYKTWPELAPNDTESTAADNKSAFLNDHFLLELKTVIRTYVLADRFMVQHVAAAVAQYVIAYLRNFLFYSYKRRSPGPDVEDLGTVLEHIYSVTGQEDIKLRGEVTTVCTAKRDLIKDEPGIVQMIECHDGRVWKAGLRTAREVKEAYEALAEPNWADKPWMSKYQPPSYLWETWESVLKEKLWNRWGL